MLDLEPFEKTDKCSQLMGKKAPLWINYLEVFKGGFIDSSALTDCRY
jgi:hypothetical protein